MTLRASQSLRVRGYPLRLLLFVLMALFLFPEGAQARRRKRPLFYMGPRHGELSFEVQNQTESRDNPAGLTLKKDEWVFKEKARVGASGWVYHPALLTYSSDVGVLFDQDWISSDPGNGTIKITGTTLLGQLNAQVLPRKSYPISLFVGKTRSDVNAPFSPRYTQDEFRYGAGLWLSRLGSASWRFPTRFSYNHTDLKSNDRLGSQYLRDDLRMFTTNETLNTRSRLELIYRKEDSKSSGLSRKRDRQELRFNNDRTLSRGNLSSYLYANRDIYTNRDNADNDSNQDNVSIVESLRLSHDHHLSSVYNYSFNYQDAGFTTNTSHSGGVGVSHQLYHSLTSGVNFGAGVSDSDLGKTTTGSGSLHINYTKEIPWGKFGLRYAPTMAYHDEDVEPGVRKILAEPHSVQIGISTFLDNVRVDPGTIEVSDPTSGLPYRLGRDYTVKIQGERTAIDVSSGGLLDVAIPPVDVNVRYDFQTSGPRRYISKTSVVGGSVFLWDHLTLDLSRSATTFDLQKGDSNDSTLDSSRILTATLSLTYPNQRTTATFEEVHENISPRKFFRVNHWMSFRPTPRIRLTASGGYSRQEFIDTGDSSQTYSISLGGTTVLLGRIQTQFNLTGRQVLQDSGDTTAASGSLSLSYYYHQLRFELRDYLLWTLSDIGTGAGQSEDLLNTVIFRVERAF